MTALPAYHTQVELLWIEKQVEHWLRFGRQAGERIIDRRRRIVSFAPGSVFAFVRWASNEYGTIQSNIDILRAVKPGKPFQTIPCVCPGGDILLHIQGWSKVERVLQAIDAIDAIEIDPADVPPDYWRHVHNRMAARLEPRRYTPIRHTAFLKRRRVGL
ncbi:DUF2840 domain-containing protein [Boseongicola sp. H5]|uniref:DUF2840 domain-containing protein n=1 Tax=Boseongicola sp. H5 TaxID=2763261 RepID=UPI001D0B3B1C|nr:DUF2840 domain-containing protein [Boseongicola sp. H5]